MVRMKCLTTKQDFDAEEPEVIVLRNGRYAYRVKCPWEGKNGKQLYAFKFASMEAYRMRMLPRLHPGTRKGR